MNRDYRSRWSHKTSRGKWGREWERAAVDSKYSSASGLSSTLCLLVQGEEPDPPGRSLDSCCVRQPPSWLPETPPASRWGWTSAETQGGRRESAYWLRILLRCTLRSPHTCKRSSQSKQLEQMIGGKVYIKRSWLTGRFTNGVGNR